MLIGIDQGTTGTTCIAYDPELRPVAHAYRELASHYPQPGWVEQDPDDIVHTVVDAVAEILARIGGGRAVTAVGLDNQGETVVAWDAITGQALTPALVWSDGRAHELAAQLARAGHEGEVHRLTGLRLDSYFCAAKYAWLLGHDRAVRAAADRGTLRLGTLDTWLAWRLGGQRFVTDQSTASRTQLLGLASSAWEQQLLACFDIPAAALAEVRPCLGDWGTLTHPAWDRALPWRASLVDQPAALAGNACFAAGQLKVSYGTGCFLLANAGTEPPVASAGLLASVAWSRASHDAHAAARTFALDGGVFTAGSALGWLRTVGLIADPAETEDLARSEPDTGGVRFLPAFTGLGAPWWDKRATGVFSGITAGTTRGHLVRAVLDAIAFRVRDLAEAAWAAGQPRPAALRVDGGLSRNGYLMQRQADVLGIAIERGTTAEATALGAAALAGIAAGVFTEADVTALIRTADRCPPDSVSMDASVGASVIRPAISEDQRESEYTAWRSWAERARALEPAH